MTSVLPARWNPAASGRDARRVAVYSRGQLITADAPGVQGGEVTEKWATGYRSSLSLTVDPSPEWLSWFKLPGLEIRPYSGMSWGSTEHLMPLGVFTVLPPAQSLPKVAVSVQADDRWAAVDFGDFGFPVPTIPGRIRDVIARLVADVQAPWADPITITSTSGAVLAAGGLWDKSRMETIGTLASSIGAEVFYGRDGGLIVQDRATSDGAPLVDGDGGTVLTVVKNPDSGQVYNAVAVSGSNNDTPFDPVVVAITDINHPAHRSNLGFERVLKFSSPLLASRDQAITAGQSLLEKHTAPALTWTVTCIPDASRKAGDLIPFTTEEWGTVQVTVQEIHYPLGDGAQSLTLAAL